MKTAIAKRTRVSSGSLQFKIVRLSTKKIVKISHHPAGKLNVMLSFDSSPYLRNPKKPTKPYIAVTIVIPMFSTPNVPPKDFGLSMLFSNAMTTPTASRANKTVPK